MKVLWIRLQIMKDMGKKKSSLKLIDQSILKWLWRNEENEEVKLRKEYIEKVDGARWKGRSKMR